MTYQAKAARLTAMNRLPVIAIILTSLLLPLMVYAQDDSVKADVTISI
jgi:hypothetical protein